MEAIGYIRVSTQEQVEEGVSLDAQRAKIKAWCLANDYELEGIYEDAGISGIRSDRQGLLSALDAVSSGAALVVYSLSRLTRSTKDMLHLSDELERRGADLVSLTEKIDTTTAAGKMVFRMLAVLNEFERDQISDRTKAALQHKKSVGEQYSPVPFGYKAINKRLIEVDQELGVVSEILKARAEGATLRTIAGDLNTRGIKGKKGGKWHASTINYLIKRQSA
jgi:site-specific DNA recombinase